MRNALLAFGAVCAVGLVAVPVITVVAAAADVVQDTLHPATYQLTLELDGSYYIEDFNLSRADCQELLRISNDWTGGRAKRTCDRSPVLEPAA
jgi:hypothetical protein